MAINMSLANAQATQLLSYADQLRFAKNQLSSYKNTIAAAWGGTEARKVLASIDLQTAKIEKAIKELELLSQSVQSAAASIKRQEDAAAAAAKARAEKQNRINTAQRTYNNALTEKDALNRELSELTSRIRKANIYQRASLLLQLESLKKAVEEAQRKVDVCKVLLDNAKR